MPSYRTTQATITLQNFDVIGQDSKLSGLVGHTGLAKSAGAQAAAQIVALDMSPPLHAASNPMTMTANVVGSASLTDDEVQKIRTFIDRHALEHKAFGELRLNRLIDAVPKIYCIYPHVVPFHEEDGRYARTRFSCSGFVFEAYRKARIILLEIADLPDAGLPEIQVAYQGHLALLQRHGSGAAVLGLDGDGPWKVLFCGYLFHALNRDAASIRGTPYTPRIEDRYFPAEVSPA